MIFKISFGFNDIFRELFFSSYFSTVFKIDDDDDIIRH